MDSTLSDPAVHPPKLFWFHCGRCGSLFQAPAGDPASRQCPHCGSDPSHGLLEPAPVETAVAEASPANVADVSGGRAGSPSGPGHSGKRSKKKSQRYFMMKLFSGWVLVLLAVFLTARLLWHEEESGNSGAAAGAAPVGTGAAADYELLKDALPQCNRAFFGFLAAGSPETRNQFVVRPLETAARMARFYQLAPLVDVDVEALTLDRRSVLALPGGPAVETTWTTPDGRLIEAVFHQEDGEWRLDWDHFVRYGDEPWSLFLAGTGAADGEFRLLARERLADQRKSAATISLVMYAPRFARPTDAGFQSPEFLVSRRSREGRLLEAGFKLAREGGTVFKSKLGKLNPDGMIRVRVKVRRTEMDTNRTFEITEVKACHWYSVEDPGVEPTPEKNEAHLPPPSF